MRHWVQWQQILTATSTLNLAKRRFSTVFNKSSPKGTTLRTEIRFTSQLDPIFTRRTSLPSSVLATTSQSYLRSHFSTSTSAMSDRRVDTAARLAVLRELMAKEQYNLDAFVVPTEDQHYSEYIDECDARRAFISGFDGSAGTAIITREEALLFTDGRYFLQATQQLDGNWTLMRQGLPKVPTWQTYLHQDLPKDSRIGIDPTVTSFNDVQTIEKSLSATGSSLIPVDTNLIDQVWGNTRPPRTQNPIFPLDVKYSGVSSENKIKALREQLTEKNASGIVINMLDEIAWLFNLRGSDIPYNPVFFAYAFVSHSETTIYLNTAQINEDVRAHLGKGVNIKPYEEIWKDLKRFGEALQADGQKVILGNTASFALANAIGREKVVILRSPVTDAKSIKNEVEIEGFRQCHIRDGSALVRYFAWLEEELKKGTVLTETEAAAQLEKYRSELPLFKGLSFPTISATGPNGSIIHYRPDLVNSAIVRKEQIYLCDSGAQFWDGTTDVTRTWHFGTPSPLERRAFTRVLQGVIGIDTVIFPEGTSGFKLDPMARRALWQDGLDYRHGTGHGVGHFLNVHEGPQGIGMRIAYNDTSLKAGMTVSNEPGYYEDGKYGIRIENIIIVKKVETPNNFGDQSFYGFENLTLCPIQTKLIDVELLTASEKDWINRYHAEVREKVGPLVKNDERARLWLEKETLSI